MVESRKWGWIEKLALLGIKVEQSCVGILSMLELENQGKEVGIQAVICRGALGILVVKFGIRRS